MEDIMSAQRRDFFLLLMLAATAIPVSGQTRSQTARPADGGAAIPDFSGIWAHLA
jgi:hypothetical protein